MVDVSKRIKKIIADKLDIDIEKIKDGSDFYSLNITDDLDADSLEVVELMMEFEEEFKIQIPDEDMERLDTVGKIVSFVDEKMKSPNVPVSRVTRPDTTPKKQPILPTVVRFQFYVGKDLLDVKDVHCIDCGMGCGPDEICKKSDAYKHELQKRYPLFDVNVTANPGNGDLKTVESAIIPHQGNMLQDILTTVFKSNGK